MRPPARYRLKSEARKIKDNWIYPTALKRASWTYPEKKRLINILEADGENMDLIIKAFPNKCPLEVNNKIYIFLKQYKDYCWALYWQHNVKELPAPIHGWITSCHKVTGHLQNIPQDNSKFLGEVMNEIAGKFEVQTPEVENLSHVIDMKRIIKYLADMVNLKPIGQLKPYEAAIFLSALESVEEKATHYKFICPQLVSRARNIFKLGPRCAQHFFNNSNAVIGEATRLASHKNRSVILNLNDGSIPTTSSPIASHRPPMLLSEDHITKAITLTLEQTAVEKSSMDMTDHSTTSLPSLDSRQQYLPSLSQSPSDDFAPGSRLDQLVPHLLNAMFALNPFCLPSLTALGLPGFQTSNAGVRGSSRTGISPSTVSGTPPTGLRVYGRSKKNINEPLVQTSRRVPSVNQDTNDSPRP